MKSTGCGCRSTHLGRSFKGVHHSGYEGLHRPRGMAGQNTTLGTVASQQTLVRGIGMFSGIRPDLG